MAEKELARVDARAEGVTNLAAERIPHIPSPAPEGESLTFAEFVAVLDGALVRCAGLRVVRYISHDARASIRSEEDLRRALGATLCCANPRRVAEMFWWRYVWAREAVSKRGAAG